MKHRMEMLEKRMDAIDAKFKGSERDYNKNQAGMTSEPNEMEVQPEPGKKGKKNLSMYVAMMKTKGKKSYA